jgi:hypothetical protein
MALRILRSLTETLAVLLIWVLGSALGARAQGLQTINPPEGGQITYGQVAGETTEAGAMGSILRNLHNRLGDRPRVGKLFDVRGSESVAVFFTVTKKNSGGGQISGMIIVAKATTDHVEAALLTDDAARFSKTLSPMTKALFKVWHPMDAGRTAGQSAGGGAPAAALHQVVLQDRSASIGLPDGWNIVTARSGGGTIIASGLNGESAEMDLEFLASDPSYPAVQQTIHTLQNGGLRGTRYENASYISYNADLSQNFLFQIQKARKRAGLAEATYNLTKVTPMGQSPQERCAQLQGTVDFNDGKGGRELSTLYCAYAPNRFGGWASLVYMTTVPMQFGARERSTMGAILQSFQVDMTVVNKQAHAIAKPEIDKIHEIGRRSAMQAQSAHEQEAIQRSSVYNHWDSIDRRSQEFENYQLNNAVISTTDHTAHGTVDADDAAYLVEKYPDKYEYVSAPDYWKGVDY